MLNLSDLQKVKVGDQSGLPVVTGVDGVLEATTFGTTAGTVCQGSDSRLSDARTPTTHNHDHNTLTNYTANRHRLVTASTASPTGGADGDVWLKY